MDEDTRRDGNPEEEQDEAGWYFDLPKGAWERQEAKNRELRQSVRRNMDTSEPKKDVFGGSTGQAGDSDEPPPLFRTRDNEEEDDDEAIRRRWHFDEPDEEPDQDEDQGPVWGNAGRSADTPPAEIPLRFKLRSEREPEDDPSPQLKPPPGLFSGEESEPRPALQGVGLDHEIVAEPEARIEEPRSQEPEEPRPFTPEPVAEAAEPEQPRSRWEEFFGQKAADDTGMLEGMRSWASGTQDPPAAADESSPPLSGSNPFADAPAAPEDSPLAGMRSWAFGAEEPSSAAGAASVPLSGSSPFADAPSASEDSLLESMRSWATSSREPDDDAFSRAQQSSASDEPPPLLDVDSLPLRRRSQEEDEPPPPPVDDEPKTRWDEMFSAKAGDDAGLLDGMRAWAKSSSADDEPAAPRRFLDADDEEISPDPSLFRPFEWEAKESSESESEWTPPPPPEEEKKGGLVGRLFGRKKQDEPQGPSAFNANWIEPEEEPAELPPTMSVSDEPQDSAPGAWLGRSDGPENRFQLSHDEEEQPPAEFKWTPTIGDDSPSPWGASELAAEQPAPPQPNDAFTTSPAASSFSTDDPWNNPKPDGSPAFSIPPESDADEMAEWASEEQPTALTTPGPVPVAEEDPWQQVQAIEEQAEPVVAEDSAPPAPVSSWAGAGEEEREESLELPAWAHPSEPASTAASEPDPWESFIERRRSSEPADETSFETARPERPAPSNAPAQPSSLWDDTFGSLQDEDAEEDLQESGDDATPAPPADPWAAIAEVSGYEAAPGGTAVFRGTQHVEDALDQYEAERAAEETVADVSPEPPSFDEEEPFESVRPAAAYEPAYPTAPDHAYYSDEEAFPSSQPVGYRAEEEGAIDLPEWDDSNISDFTVVRAFERHASAYDEAMAPPEDPVFDDLLGDGAEDIVAEASEAATDAQYFGRMQGGWAPQRTATGERPLYPWEIDHDQPSREPDGRDEDGTWGYSGGSQPPWHDDAAVGAAAHGAPSVRRSARSRMLVREIVETGLLALLVFLAVRASFQNFKVDGLSMWPTLEDGEYLIVNKLAYAEVDMERLSNFVPFVEPGEDPNREVFGGPERGDIIVLRDPTEPETDLIKRIIGLPGETLEIVDGKVYINDHLLMEPYIKQEWHDTKPKIAIPEGYYFVMGDNRENSKDSRNGSIGLIPRDLIIGKAMLTYWPRDKFGLAPNEAGDISERDGRPEVTAQTIQD